MPHRRERLGWGWGWGWGRVVSPVAVDVAVDYRRRPRSGVGVGEFGDRAVRPATAITNAGLLFEHPGSRDYDPRAHIAEHPDTPERIDAIDAALAAVDWLGWERRVAPMVTRAELEAVHDADLVDTIEQLVVGGGGSIDDDTHVDAAGYRAARHAGGAACAMVRALMAGETRPRSRRCVPQDARDEPARWASACLTTSPSRRFAIDHLGVRRVFILDWDVHHGNGTAEIFRRRDDVLYASIRQANTFPHSGPLRDAGSGTGLGYTINLPVPAGSDGERWLSLLEHVVLPAATAFRPSSC